MADESYWSYRPSTPTPGLEEAIAVGAIRADTTEQEWYKLTPGMRREIVCNRKKQDKS